MDQSANSSNASDGQYQSVTTHPEIKYRPMPDPLSVYVPLKSLTKETINSVVTTAHQSESRDWHFSRRTLLAFLLAINNQLTQIEHNPDSTNQLDEETIEHAPKVRQWLTRTDKHGNSKEIEWDDLRERYHKMTAERNTGLADYFRVNTKDVQPYYELTIEGLHADVNQSREYMAQFRSHGWDPSELKVYWDVKQLEDLCPKDEIDHKETTSHTPVEGDTTVEQTKEEESSEVKSDHQETKVEGEEVQVESKEEVETKDQGATTSKLFLHDPSDVDAVRALRQYPVSKRNHAGTITYVNKGIEKAVFDAPEDAQLIVLNFANERSPGGGYLRHAWAQEEIILYNSDGYRSLLDLKYGRMGGGYAIPEFGTAYVRDIRFVDRDTDRVRKADMLVSACYCVTGSAQLFDNPETREEWFANNKAKFRAFIAAAVANTIGDGSNTYLLLGPIGTGAFGNDTKSIGYVFRDVLSSKMMGSKGPIQNVFGNIWFVSTDKWKNDLFEKILNASNSFSVE